MNTKRVIFWVSFVVVIGLIVWGMILAMNKESTGPKVGEPAPVTTADNMRGNPDAVVTLIEYSDFQCPACEAYYPLVEKIMESSSTTLRMVYRHYPLAQHPNAFVAAKASEAARLQGKFWEMHDMLFENHTEWTELSDPRSVFEGFAGNIGLDVSKFSTDIESVVVRDRVQSQMDEGQSVGISYTPSFFVNGKLITNPQSYEEFKTVIDTAVAGSQN